MIECNECGKIGDHSKGGPFCELNKEISKLEVRVKELEERNKTEIDVAQGYHREIVILTSENERLRKKIDVAGNALRTARDGLVSGDWRRTHLLEALRELDVSHTKQTEQKVQNEKQSELDGIENL